MAGTWNNLSKQPGVNIDTMLLLTDGRVFCHEFQSNKWHTLTPSDAGDYTNGSWNSVAPMPDNTNIPASFGGRIAGSQVEVIDDCGHVVQADQPERSWTAISKFLAG